MTSTFYQKQYENNKTQLERIEKKLAELDKLSPEEQNKLYFKQAISEEIWRKKYKAKSDKSVVDTWKRVAKFLSQNEIKKDIWYLYFFDLLEGFKFTGAGRILANADFEKTNVTLQNCYTSSKIDDSITGIMEVLKEAAIVHKMGGGIGYNFSTIRPKGALVNSTGGKASGPISFAHIFDQTCRTITSIGGRFGAQMLLLDVSHPDIEEFITAKESTANHAPLTRFNLSVLITDDFMKAVKENKDWKLIFDGKVYKTVKARYLWDLITKHAYDYAEPGILNIDTANKYNNLWFIKEERVSASNPCLPDNVFITTIDGIFQVKDLIDKPFEIYKDGKVYRTISNGFFYTGKKPVYKVITKEGFEIEATLNHEFKVINDEKEYEWKQLKDLQPGDKLPFPDYTNFDWNGEGTEEEGYLLGVLIGDGHISHYTEDKLYAKIQVWNPQGKPTMMQYIEENMYKIVSGNSKNHFKGWNTYDSYNDKQTIGHTGLLELAQKFGLDIGYKTITDKMEKTSKAFYIGLIRGLFDTDGTIYDSTKNWNLRLSQTNLDLLQKVQRMLARLGIKSTLYRNRRIAGYHKLPDGHGGYKDYHTKALHELHIGGQGIVKFYEVIGFYNDLKQKRLEEAVNTTKFYRQKPYYRVEKIEYVGEKDVYDVTIENIHEFEGNLFQIHNCGEQLLPYNGSCNLGSFNLTQFVDNPFDSSSSFNFDLLSFYILIAVRFMDNVIDLTQQPNEKFTERQKFARRVGIGTTGLADTLAMLGIKYNKNNLEFIEKIYQFIRDNVYNSSVELAKEKAPAPAVETKEYREKYLQGNFIKRMLETNEKFAEDFMKYGIRNTYLLSIAPTGTISLLMNNVSSGIEPIFSNSYKRYVKNVDETREERIIMDYAYKLWKDKFGDKPLPDYWVTTFDLDIDDHLYVLATIQKYIGASISKTINVPTDYPFEKFQDIFTKAYDLEIKGVTVYRPNPNLDAVLVAEDNKNTKKKETPKRKRRPFMLSGRTYKLKTPKEKYSYYITINDFIDDDNIRRPFEIFINTKDPKQPIFGFIARLLSALFRREKDISFIIKEMQNTVVNNEGFFDPVDGKFIHSLIAYIGKIIKRHVDNYSNDNFSFSSNSLLFFDTGKGKGEKESSSRGKEDNDMSPFGVPWNMVEICPECHTQAVVNNNGCKTCMNCGYSKCD